MRVRKIGHDTEVVLVAERMRQTLIEVLGQERGESMYSMEWLVDRVRFHLDGERCTGEVFVAQNEAADIVGHTIVRLEEREVGLFSTFYVAPEFRRVGVASLLVEHGEEWMRNLGAERAVTYTDEHNLPLQRLMIRRGYRLEPMPDGFVGLVKEL